jgi:hypothetical protein
MADSVKCLGFNELLKKADYTQCPKCQEIVRNTPLARSNHFLTNHGDVPYSSWETIEWINLVSVDVLKQWQEQFQDFLRHNDRNVLEMFCQQGPPSKRWIETEGQYWQGWQDCNRKVRESFGETLLSKEVMVLNEKVKIFCHCCEGLGLVDEDGYPDHHVVKAICPECNGEGWVWTEQKGSLQEKKESAKR